MESYLMIAFQKSNFIKRLVSRYCGELILGAIAGSIIWVILAWLTHLVVCFKAGSWGFLLAGAIFFPVALVHGTGVWVGMW